MTQHLEQKLQEQFAAWLTAHNILHCASIGGVNLGKLAAICMKRKGYRRGFPDHMILEPRGKYHGLFIELKVNNKRKNDDQDWWKTQLIDRGYAAITVPGELDFFAARDWLERNVKQYLSLTKEDV